MRTELTIRGLFIGALITIVFTAANVYLGLKVGLTFATSIPAAVISMAVLRMFRNSTIWENNIVQTVASAAGTLSSIIFVLPGLVMVGWWTGFPFWESFAICASGGILGVMYSVPLRRALVTTSDLPYPEGVAAAEVLKVGSGEGADAGEAVAENKLGLLALVWSSVASASLQVFGAMKLMSQEFDFYFRGGNIATGLNFSASLALIGAGHLIGLTVGIAILVGLIIAWGIAVPILTAMHPAPGAAIDVAMAAFKNVRFIGAGTIGIGAIWTIGKLVAPITTGIASSMRASRQRKANGEDTVDIVERDLPIGTVALISLVAMIPIVILLYGFLAGGALQSMVLPLIIGGLLYIVLAGFLVAAACGYMAGLIGSSNSPVSGLAILSILGASVLLVVMARSALPAAGPALVAYALFITAVLLNVATISNNNLQDLKTGQLVEATPWKQQIALVIGVIFGAIVIPPVLNMLNAGIGFGGAHGLPAPQATLISTLAVGVIKGGVPWNLIWVGVAVGVVIIVLDEIGAATKRFQLPPLAVGLGIYLPAAATAPVVVGAVFGALYNRWIANKPNADAARRLGVLIASGLIVGESLIGVVIAGLIAAHLDISVIHGDWFNTAANVLGVAAFIGFPIVLYRWIGRKAQAL